MEQKRKLCNRFLCFSILFLVICLLIGTSLGAADAESPRAVSQVEKKGPCQNIKIQQKEIFEKLARIENQINAKNIID